MKETKNTKKDGYKIGKVISRTSLIILLAGLIALGIAQMVMGRC